MSSHISNERPQPDKVLTDIVDYVLDYEIQNEVAWQTAQYCLLDTLGCGISFFVIVGIVKTDVVSLLTVTLIA